MFFKVNMFAILLEIILNFNNKCATCVKYLLFNDKLTNL